MLNFPAVQKHMPKLLLPPVRCESAKSIHRIRRRQVIIFVQFEVLRKMPGTSADWLVYHGLIVGL